MQKILYLIAGEASGDNLGAKLMLALKEKNANLEFHGIGGPKMQEAGLNLLFPAQELSLMGFFEIIPHIPKLLFRIKQTIDHICAINPDAIITIDSPGFCFRVAKKIKKLISGKLIHYVAPTVWAYKPERAKKIAKIYDHLLVILPFEPEYFIKEGLNTSFIGHPAIEDLSFIPREIFRQKFNLSNDDLLICLTPGSRKQEIKTLLPIFLAAIDNFKKLTKQNIIIAIPTLEHLKSTIMAINNNRLNIILVDEIDKQALFSSSDLALTKSGTITTELAFYKLPIIVAHKVNIFSYWLLKKMIKVKYVTIINILAEKELIPELLQGDCSIEAITDKLLYYSIKDNRNSFMEEIQLNLAKLIPKNSHPSQIAAQEILSIISNSL